MRGYVASWFFPPTTSSEGIVTYKLLRRSSHEYDVCSSSNDRWGYQAKMTVEADNIRVFQVNTSSVDEWVDVAVETFERLHSERPFDFIMTRSMPPESIRVGLRIKEKYPEIKWLASMGDPIANNPYELYNIVKQATYLSEKQKEELQMQLVSGKFTSWGSESQPAGIRWLVQLKRLEDAAFQQADLLICPSEAQRQYTLRGRSAENKIVAIPHSFEKTMYPDMTVINNDKIILTYLGSTDERRSLKPLVQTLKWIRDQKTRYDYLISEQKDYSVVLDKLLFRFVGNHPRNLKDMVINYYLDEQVEFVSDVDYLTSLKMMKESNWLIHVDAYFPEIQPGGSIFFAGKLADYVGAERPILGFTGKGSPADHLIQGIGGLCIYDQKPETIANQLLDIANGKNTVDNAGNKEEYRKRFDAEVVAKKFDQIIEQRISNATQPKNSVLTVRKKWDEIKETVNKKIVTICVPSYNVQQYIDRCLHTLICCHYSPYLDIIVVNDGSIDHTSEIAHLYQQRYPGIVSVVDKENGGHGSTINCALQYARGKYFMVVDADDWIDTDAFEKLLEPIISEKIDVDLVSSHYHLIDIENSEMTLWKQEWTPEYGRVYRFDELDLKHSYFTLASSLFKTEILKKHGQQLQQHTYFVDVEYILFPIPYISTVLFSNLEVYRYCRGNAEQSVYIPNMVKRFDHHDRVIRRVIAYYCDTVMSDSQKKYMEGIIFRVICTHYDLMFTYEEDTVRGCKRAKEFSAYLKKSVPELYRKAYKGILLLRVAENAHYVPSVYEKKKNSFYMKVRRKVKRIIIGGKRKLKNSKRLRSMLYSKTAYNLRRSRLFCSLFRKIVKK